MKQFFAVEGSLHGFHDIHREFDSLRDADRAFNEMVRDGIKCVCLSQVLYNGYYYSKSLKISNN